MMEKKINNGGPAFPRSCGECGRDVDGMSLRDWFAGMALSNPQTMAFNGINDEDNKSIARRAYKIADAMILEGEIS